MGRTLLLALSAAIVISGLAARADGLPPLPPLDVSGWYLRGNVDAPAHLTEGQSRLQPNLLADLANGPARPAHYSMSEMR
jgi:hypothetical protein